MTVRELIKELLIYPMLEAQVCDSSGSPIMCTKYLGRENNDIALIPKSEINIEASLDDFFEQMIDEGYSDWDVAEMLQVKGYTLDDLKNYRQDTYEWAVQYWDEPRGKELEDVTTE